MLAQFVNGALVAHPVHLLLTAAFTLLLGSFTPALLPADQTGRPVQDFAAVSAAPSAPNRGASGGDDGASLVTAAPPSSSSSETVLPSFGGGSSKGQYQRIADVHRQR